MIRPLPSARLLKNRVEIGPVGEELQRKNHQIGKPNWIFAHTSGTKLDRTILLIGISIENYMPNNFAGHLKVPNSIGKTVLKLKTDNFYFLKGNHQGDANVGCYFTDNERRLELSVDVFQGSRYNFF